MFYTDIHSHMLFDADDGAKDEAMMYGMLDMAYNSGTRAVCMTPHYHPLYYGHNQGRSQLSFDLLCAYAKEKYPDMTLAIANELGYHTDCILAVERGECRLLGGKYLLMDFLPTAPLFTVRYGMEEMLAAGYRVVLAHVERYNCLHGQEDLLADWERRGALFQVNASAFSRGASFRTRRFVKALMRHALVHAVAADAHDLTTRPPVLAEAEAVITKNYGEDIAKLLLFELPMNLMTGKNF